LSEESPKKVKNEKRVSLKNFEVHFEVSFKVPLKFFRSFSEELDVFWTDHAILGL
jgi:hypothetical protein